MAKITQQFCLDESNFIWLMEEMRYRKRKNLSRTLNEILKNYQYMVRSIQNAQKEKERDERKRIQAEEFAQAYKKQIKATEELKEDIKKYKKGGKEKNVDNNAVNRNEKS